MALPSKPIDTFRRAMARRLRARSTDAEEQLWRRLRRFPMAGSHFRRQVPIGSYVADFACLAARLIIEVDGSQHASGRQAANDADRTRWFEAEGYRVIRFWNNDIVHNIEGVMGVIYAALYGSIEGVSTPFSHVRHRSVIESDHPTPTRKASLARRPSPSRGG